MTSTSTFTAGLLVCGAALLGAVLSTRLSARLRIAAPALLLVVAAVASAVAPGLRTVTGGLDQPIVSVGLALILFDGGLRIGWRTLRSVLGAASWLALTGTLVTAAALAALAHYGAGLQWSDAILLGAALSPTDPAVVFSVLGSRQISGRVGTLLEAEAGLNDPVGIALLIAVLGSAGGGIGFAGQAAEVFVTQMVVGAALGLGAGFGLRLLMRRLLLPSGTLHMLFLVAAAIIVFAATTLVGGSGFLAVFLSGIVIGDTPIPFNREVRSFVGGLANLGEIVAFVVLGLTIDLPRTVSSGALPIGLGLAVILLLVIRPLLGGLLMIPVRGLSRGERGFALLGGLKGAVPILLGLSILDSGRPGASRVFDLIVLVVLVSVLVQASLIPWLARRLRVPMTSAEVLPWVAGLRFEERPDAARRIVVEAGSRADGRSLDELPLTAESWVSMIRRGGQAVPVLPSSRLQAADELLAFTSDDAFIAAFRRAD